MAITITPNVGWFQGMKFLNEVLSGLGGGTKSTASTVTSTDSAGTTKTVLTLTNHIVNTTEAGAAGAYGGSKLLTFPAKNIIYLGASANLTLAKQGAGITDTAAVVYALGTVTAAGDATLTSTEANLIASTAATLTGGVTPVTVKGKSVTAAIAAFDGEAAAKEVFLNFAMPDAGSTANDALVVNGTITIIWAAA